MRGFVKPRVVVSKCMEFASCRYNGAMISSPVVKLLKSFVDFEPVCAEVEIGLGVPRSPIRIVTDRGAPRLVQPETGLDVTEKMEGFAEAYLSGLRDVDGFILKSRSPSCGIKDTKIFAGIEKGSSMSKGAGFFGRAVMAKFPGLAIEDEGRLMNYRIREHFLTAIYTFAAFRRVKAARAMKDLVEFQSEYKYLLMAYNQKELRVLGRIVANPERLPVTGLLEAYEEHLRQALAAAPRYRSCINVLMHALGYFSRELGSKEKAYFLGTLDEFRDRRLPLSVPIGIIKSYIVRFEEPYLARQAFFEPYPEELVSIADSGKGRDL
jgi:uncharacterized protein YbgA (DUF1722 family)/uncharacterized protein YbbK (DUF523 family)